MLVTTLISDVRSMRHDNPRHTWGLVPTMGALHDGHLSLIRRARSENDRVAVSIFINPTQFNNADDLEKYPRTMKEDLAQLDAEGVDLVWTPDPDMVYPPDFQTYVTVEEITKPLEGTHRPGHFKGVTTVVAKLFNVFEPHRAYFGQKDAQQAAVIKQMVRDLNFNLEVVVCPIIREPDGLALSSRNKLLSTEEREAAVVLSKALTAAKALWERGERDADELRVAMTRAIDGEPLARIDYISVADPNTLTELEGTVRSALLSMAVYIGETRLIDNIRIGTE